jgi:single-strand DNA-binding protein
MNLVAVIGNVASDVELRYTPAGKAVATFRIAVSRPSGDQADFFTVVAWERQAEVCNEYLTKGRRVAVDGRLHHSTWDSKDGEKRSKVEIVANRVHLLSGRIEEDTPIEPSEPVAAAVSSDEAIPF